MRQNAQHLVCFNRSLSQMLMMQDILHFLFNFTRTPTDGALQDILHASHVHFCRNVFFL